MVTEKRTAQDITSSIKDEEEVVLEEETKKQQQSEVDKDEIITFETVSVIESSTKKRIARRPASIAIPTKHTDN